MGSPKVIGTTDQFKEIASKMRVNTAILAITHDRPSGLVSRILEARLKERGRNNFPNYASQLQSTFAKS